MKLLVLLLLVSTLHAQSYTSMPAFHPKCDTIIYHRNSETFAIYKYGDGSAKVQGKAGTAYYNRRQYRRWKRKHVKI